MASSKKVRKKRSPGDFLQFLALSIIGGFVLAGILVPPTVGAGLLATSSINWFKGLPADMASGPLSRPSVVYASDGKTELASFYSQNRSEVPLDKISQDMKDAIISIEDRDFYKHGAVSPMGIARALINNVLRPNSRQGASTLTQQYVNNLLVDSAEQTGVKNTGDLTGKKTYLGKITEIKLSISMEQNMSKDEILEGYLNIVNLGGSNYGVEAAAQFYWGIPASKLNLPQSAMLAGMVQGPNLYRPDWNPELAKERRNVVLGAMLRDKKISEDEYNEAITAELDLDLHYQENGCAAAGGSAYFCDYVSGVIFLDPDFGETPEERAKNLYRGGYAIYTTLKTDAQKSANDAVNGTQPGDNNPDDVNTALVSVEPSNGNIIAMAQNSRYAEATEANATSLFNYNVDAAYGGTAGFQAGSTFKPVVLAEWINAGKGVNAIIDGTSLNYPKSFGWNAKCLDGGKFYYPDPENRGGWTFKNATGGYQTWGSVRFGLANSINSYLYSMVSKLDLCNIEEMAGKLRITSPLTGKPAFLVNDISSSIGSQPVSPLTMASAYATFANEGVYCEPRAITKVLNRDDSVKKEYKPKCEEAISKDVANGVSYALKDVIVNGSAYERGIGLPDASAAKTGTNDNSSQTWMVGYTRGLSTASWVGSIAQGTRSLNGLSINGRVLDYVDGATYAGSQWQRFMRDQAPKYNTDKFAVPSNGVLSGTQ